MKINKHLETLLFSNILEKGIRVSGLGSIPGGPIKVPEGGFEEGTIRTWVDGDVVKKNGKWVPILIPEEYHKLGKKISSVVNKILRYITPIEGKYVIEKILSKFLTKTELTGANFRKKSTWGETIGYTIDIGLYQLWVSDFIFGNSNLKPPSEEQLNKLMEELYRYESIYAGSSLLSKEDQFKFDEILKYLDNLTKEYIPIVDVLKKIKEFEGFIEKYKDNFIVSESIKIKIEGKFRDYKKKFKEEILKDEMIRLQKELDIDVKSSSTDKFYDGIEKGFEKGERMQELLEARYINYLNLKLEGDWDLKTFKAIENFEKFALNLPKGHILSNPKLTTLDNHSYSGTGRGNEGYAFYNENLFKISLSDSFLSKIINIDRKGNLQDPIEFNAIMSHEIGHSVAAKLKDKNNYDYKRFVMECGWDNRQSNLDATSGNRAPKRLGRNSNKSLLTSYSYQSPNEAFAEYYSFYYSHKDKLDKWLETGDEKYLKGDVGTTWNKEEFDKMSDEEIMLTMPTDLYKTLEEKKILPKGGILEIIKSPFNQHKKEAIFKYLENGYVTYIDTDISIYKIKQNYKALKIIKEKVFEQELLIKSFQNIGILI